MDMTSENQVPCLGDVTVRMACEEDYEGVLAIIPNLYDGKDYLPVCYHAMLKDPKRFFVIGEVAGEIVALQTYFILDGDRCMLGEAGRMKPEYRGNRLSQLLFHYVISRILEKYPNVTYLSYTSQNEREILKTLSGPYLEKMFYRHIVRLTLQNNESVKGVTSQKRFLDLWQDVPLSMTKQLLPSEAVDTLNGLVDTQAILAEPFWVVNYEPFKPMPSNHVTMVKDNKRGIPVVVTTANANGLSIALSFGVTTVIKEGIMLTIDFYCHREILCTKKLNNTIYAHLLRHLIALNQLKGPYKKLVLDVVIHRDLSTDMVFEGIRKVGLVDFQVIHSKKRVYCVQTNFKQYIAPKL